MVLKESMWLLGIGVVLGIPAALAATRLVQAQLFGLSPSDPVTLAVAVRSDGAERIHVAAGNWSCSGHSGGARRHSPGAGSTVRTKPVGSGYACSRRPI